ncbi:3'5'-cyclic nucleotide phosphodiesterase domain-containing protein [Cardiosporidium cionae]|uniref:Phosphodiesterase n=1 Tax=Cardiosporidium cionae TaxID=476202 RepID=A0ABQ7JEP3_9APIC|nr:3'5'-cyclic nucleotide phosphodiesterase domain-containing protein [Cardiosporidium cionae]|eukprot:KAF8822488.1 3'5'-cyclic nucleotide phosphodiesterase domain-containing protein [Cardiosporidium cionae]
MAEVLINSMRVIIVLQEKQMGKCTITGAQQSLKYVAKNEDISLIHNESLYCANIIEKCHTTLCNSKNLYTHEDIISAYLSAGLHPQSFVFTDRDQDQLLSDKQSLNATTTSISDIPGNKSTKRLSTARSETPFVAEWVEYSSQLSYEWLNDLGKRMNEWSFNCLQYAQDNRFPLASCGLVLLNKTINDLGISSHTLKRFLGVIEEHYKPVRYHNSMHAAMVAQKMHCLLRKLHMFEFMDPIEYLIAILSGLCHDVGHPGRNNSFFINSMEPLAIAYNDIAVLENYHSSLTFRFMKFPGCNVFKDLPINFKHVSCEMQHLRYDKCSALRLARSRVIELILATDMSAHFDKLSLFRVRRISNQLNYTSKDDLWLTLQMVIKTGDLAHCVTEWNEHSQWCTRLVEEFFEQGDEERSKGIVISPLCDRQKLSEVAQSQVKFLSYVVSPLFAEMEAIDENGFIELVHNLLY